MWEIARFRTPTLILIFLSFGLLFQPKVAWSQIDQGKELLKNLDSKKLSSKDLESLLAKIHSESISIDQFAERALQEGANPKEVAVLVEKLKDLEKSNEEKELEEEFLPKEGSNTKSNRRTKEEELPEQERIFGMELFKDAHFAFEPNLRIPTPQGYQIGAGDELIIDIYGYSEQTFAPKVSQDGMIRLPNVGLVSVGGLTLEEANSKIKRSLSNVFAGVSDGKTKVSISLGKINSIKVLVTGEVVRPGSYTVPSLASVFNVLYAAGGPSKNGSFRKIVVVRNNKIVSRLDIYDFLKTGVAKSNIRLQENDVIKVFPYVNRIKLLGEVKRQGYYESKENETLSDILEVSGGFTSKAYKSRVKVTRNTDMQKSVADVPLELFGLFKLQNGDVFYVDSLLDRYENRVTIEGAVYRPGDYQLEPGLTVAKLLKKADGLKEEAFLTRGIIYRLGPDNLLQMLSFNPEEIVQGKVQDIELKREDKVQIAYKSEMKEGRKVVVSGEVLFPGIYDFAENMTIADLIVAAGGFKESASVKRVEVARRKLDVDRKSVSTEISIVKQFELSRDLKAGEGVTFKLEAFDMVSIYRNEGLVTPRSVKIEGEVMFPGTYVLNRNNETISDLINRSGGLTGQSYKEGAMLLRKKQFTSTENILNLNKRRALKQQSKDSLNTRKIEDFEKESPYDVVGIDLEKILKRPGGLDDLLVRDGDILVVPDAKQTVLVSGEVLYPVRIRFEKNNSLRGYVSEAGGFSAKALKRKSYVVYPNGRAKATKSFLGIKFYPKVIAGSEIVVPTKADRRAISAIEYATIITSLTSLLLLTYTLIQ